MLVLALLAMCLAPDPLDATAPSTAGAPGQLKESDLLLLYGTTSARRQLQGDVSDGARAAPLQQPDAAAAGAAAGGTIGSKQVIPAAMFERRRQRQRQRQHGQTSPHIFLGVFTGHNPHGRPAADSRYDYALRRTIVRATWLGAHKQREQAAASQSASGAGGGSQTASADVGAGGGVMVRFVAGVATEDPEAEAALSAEAAREGDFMRLPGVRECYVCLTNKTRAFFAAVVTAHPGVRWVIKADDDTYWLPQRLPAAAVQWERMGAGYIGCMKHGRVWSNPHDRWYDPDALLVGPEYYMHAYGSGYVLSAAAVRHVIVRNYHHLRLLANEDTAVGLWCLAHDVLFFEDMRLCSPYCDPAALVVVRHYCAGMCNLTDMAVAHEGAACKAPVTRPLPFLPSHPAHTAFERLWKLAGG